MNTNSKNENENENKNIDPSEIKKLETVRALITAQLQDAAEKISARRTELASAHKDIWAETPIIRNMDDVLNLTMLSAEIAQHERQYDQANTRLQQLKTIFDTPYFARIDFVEDGESEETGVEQIYIGKHSLFKNGQFEVYDWRAPISSLYYDHGIGPAAFTVQGEQNKSHQITGKLTLKRQYHIRGGQLVYLFDSELTIDDDILQFELSRATEARIKTIINTI